MPLQRAIAVVQITLQEWDAILCTGKSQLTWNFGLERSGIFTTVTTTTFLKAFSGNIWLLKTKKRKQFSVLSRRFPVGMEREGNTHHPFLLLIFLVATQMFNIVFLTGFGSFPFCPAWDLQVHMYSIKWARNNKAPTTASFLAYCNEILIVQFICKCPYWHLKYNIWPGSATCI